MTGAPDTKATSADTVWPEDAVEVGRILDAWGVKGGIKVQAYSADAEALFTSRRWFLQPPEDSKPLMTKPNAKTSALPQQLKILSVRDHGEGLVAMIQGVTDRNGAEALRGARIFISRSAFPSADPDEFYWVDLIGCELTAEGGVVLGKVAEVLDNGAHAILRVQRYAAPKSAPAEGEVSTDAVAGTDPDPWMRDAKGRIQEVLVPFVDAFVGTVDIAARRIDTTWPVDF